eukprot:1138162-Pelagomonas_calceolata.AAC.5
MRALPVVLCAVALLLVVLSGLVVLLLGVALLRLLEMLAALFGLPVVLPCVVLLRLLVVPLSVTLSGRLVSGKALVLPCVEEAVVMAPGAWTSGVGWGRREQGWSISGEHALLAHRAALAAAAARAPGPVRVLVAHCHATLAAAAAAPAAGDGVAALEASTADVHAHAAAAGAAGAVALDDLITAPPQLHWAGLPSALFPPLPSPPPPGCCCCCPAHPLHARCPQTACPRTWAHRMSPWSN